MSKQKANIKEFPASLGYASRVEEEVNAGIANGFLRIATYFMKGRGLAFAYVVIHIKDEKITCETATSVDCNLPTRVKDFVLESLKSETQRLAVALSNGSLDDLTSGE